MSAPDGHTRGEISPRGLGRLRWLTIGRRSVGLVLDYARLHPVLLLSVSVSTASQPSTPGVRRETGRVGGRVSGVLLNCESGAQVQEDGEHPARVACAGGQ